MANRPDESPSSIIPESPQILNDVFDLSTSSSLTRSISSDILVNTIEVSSMNPNKVYGEIETIDNMSDSIPKSSQDAAMRNYALKSIADDELQRDNISKEDTENSIQEKFSTLSVFPSSGNRFLESLSTALPGEVVGKSQKLKKKSDLFSKSAKDDFMRNCTSKSNAEDDSQRGGISEELPRKFLHEDGSTVSVLPEKKHASGALDDQLSEESTTKDSQSLLGSLSHAGTNTALLPTTPPSVKEDSTDNSYHQLKWIIFNGKKIPILTQNENGPCPMIALANVLLLNGKLTLPTDCEFVNGDRIITFLCDLILSHPSSSSDENSQLNYEKNLSDSLCLFPKLKTGLDINIRFSGVGAFEYTLALNIFDLLEVPIFHGWLVDPQDIELVSIIGDRTYNQVVELAIQNRSSSDPTVARNGLLIEEFLERTASQLTYHGICELFTTLHESQLAVFFRNNHFNTIYKHKGHLYVLVTDAGFLNEPNFVWEVLDDVGGDTNFVDSEFRLSTPKTTSHSESISHEPSNFTPSRMIQSKLIEQQQTSDFNVAKKLQTDFDRESIQQRTNNQRNVPHQQAKVSSNQNRASPHQAHQKNRRNASNSDDSCTLL